MLVIEMRKLKQLIQLMKDNDLSELDLRDEKEQVTLKRGSQVQLAPVAPAAAAPPPAAAPPAPAGPAGQAEPSPADAGLVEIPSPMVGTFYAAPSPDADAYVGVGSTVEPESVVCVIEAMKVFNEIRAEVTGRIEQILVGNGQAVEYGQPLMLVKPD